MGTDCTAPSSYTTQAFHFPFSQGFMRLLIAPDLNDSGWIAQSCFMTAFIVLPALICNLPKVLLDLSIIKLRNVPR